MKRILLPCLILLLGALAGCGGSSKATPPQVSVTVSPGTASVIAGQTQQFTATVSGASNTAVTWSLSGTGCSGAACGSIDANGMYKAPSPIPASATVTVVATSAADSSKQGTATMTHLPVVVAVTPATLTLISADTKQFTAAVSNVAAGGSAGVTWTVTGGGSIDDNGLYTAPAKVTVDANVKVTATSKFDSTKASSVTFVVKAALVTVSPETIVMDAGGAQQRFVATVTNVPAGLNGVTWYLNGLGVLDLDGLYHSPMLVSAPATAIIQAVPVFDDSKVGKASVALNPLLVTVSSKAATLYAGQTHQFAATVVHHVNQSVTWTVSGSNCAGAACGTVDTNGLYAAPSSIANDITVSLTATSVADTSKWDSATVTLVPVSVTVSPKTATVSVSATQQFTATVAGSSSADVTWSISGSGCSGNGCGTISTTGLYTAPATVPVSTVTVTATSVADPSRSDTATVTVSLNMNAKLAGAYAFSYFGYDAAGKALYAIGSFVADGHGALNGLIDTNGNGAGSRSLNTAFSGTYQVAAGGNRGQAVFNLPASPMTFRFSMDSSGDEGYMIRFDSSGSYGSGAFKRQTTSDFLLSKLNGDYVLSMSGTSYAGDERNAVVGRLHTDGTGATSSTSLDAASTTSAPINLTFTGTFGLNSGTGAANGRGILAVGVSGLGTLNFSYYMVDQDEAFILSSDQTSLDLPLLTGSIVRQTGGPFSNASFNGKSVFYLIGITLTTPRRSAVTMGQFDVTNGAGYIAYTYNLGGSASSGGSTVNSAIDANGRGTLTSALFGPYVLYLVAPNSGFLMQYDNPGTGVGFGFFEPQSGGPFSNATLSGEYYGGTLLSPSNGVGYGTGIQNWNGGGAWAGTGDVAGIGVGTMPDISSSGTYYFSDLTGRGNWLQTSPSSYSKAMYVVSPNKILFITNELGVINPGFEIFEK